MTREEYEHLARQMVAISGANFTTTTDAYIWLAENGIEPEVLGPSSEYDFAVAMFGMKPKPMVNRRQREEWASDHGWADPDLIARVAVAYCGGEYSSPQQYREIVVLQTTQGETSLYITRPDGSGYTTNVPEIEASF